MKTFLGKIWRRIATSPGLAIMAGSDRHLASLGEQSFRLAGLVVMLYSLLAGLAIVGVWGTMWPVYDKFGTTNMPAVISVAFIVLLPCRSAAASLAELLGGRKTANKALAAAAIVVVLLMCFLRVTQDPVYHPETYLPGRIAWIRPDYEIYRVLLLMPLWGGWATLAVCLFCKSRRHSEPAIAKFARQCGPMTAACCMGLIMAVSIMYFNFLPWQQQLIMIGGTVAAAIIGGIIMCLLAGGLKRKSLLAANMLTQIAFIMLYLANR